MPLANSLFGDGVRILFSSLHGDSPSLLRRTHSLKYNIA
jgi:hypothetical protein